MVIVIDGLSSIIIEQSPLSELVDYTYILHKGTGDLTSAGSIFASIGLSVRLSASDWFMVA